jgi:hypothetical protein
MAGDVRAARGRGAAPVGNVPQDALERADLARSADHAPMHPDRHHLRLVRVFSVQPIEGLDQVFGKVAGAAEPLRVEELHLVGIKGIGQHRVALASDIDKYGGYKETCPLRPEDAECLETPGIACANRRA